MIWQTLIGAISVLLEIVYIATYHAKLLKKLWKGWDV